MPPGYRYVSPSEVLVIQAGHPWRVPNVDPAGMPKTVYFTWDLYASASHAELALQIGAHNPMGRLHRPLTGWTST